MLRPLTALQMKSIGTFVSHEYILNLIYPIYLKKNYVISLTSINDFFFILTFIAAYL